MFGTYNRLGLHATASDREVIRATRRIINPQSLRNPKLRQERKRLYRTMISHHAKAAKVFRAVLTGDF